MAQFNSIPPNTNTPEKVPTWFNSNIIADGIVLDQQFNTFEYAGWMAFLMDCVLFDTPIYEDPQVWKEAVKIRAIEMAQRFNRHSPYDFDRSESL